MMVQSRQNWVLFHLYEILYLDGNLLSGQIPSRLGSLSNLTDLSDNVLSGELPDELGHLTNLEYLDIRGNNFNGQIPAFIAQWKNIRELYLMGNNFEWPVSHEVFQSLKNLEILQLADITGSPRDFPIVNNQSLTHLLIKIIAPEHSGIAHLVVKSLNLFGESDLSFNNLVGELPTFASDNLKYIYLRGNMLNNSSLGWFTNISNSSV
ncbi:unnamed protein product [Camellia sinensis]